MKSLVLVFVLSLSVVTEVAARDCILTFRQAGKDFDDASRGLREELAGDFDIKEIVVNKKTDDGVVVQAMKRYQPKLVVLMDNSSIGLYRKYQLGLAADAPVVPSVALMGIMVKEAIAEIKNAAGISYEIPIVTSIVSLRSVLGIPMKSVGVVHREYLRDFLKENREFCKRENISIVDEVLPNKGTSYTVLTKKALGRLMSQQVDALWIPNDNSLLQPKIITGVWLPFVKKYKIPIVVGVEVLVAPKINLGTFAVLPDHVALGTQAAGIVYDIMEHDWTVGEKRIDPPLAVYKIINLPQAKKNFNVSEENLKSIDKKLK